ncbi:MAG TPA: 16S rRNA (guanine(966)-N(2))-methyltransferase RsmD [Lachnospiraceae bacterium]|jgi:16S rRNA (guanine966-N2)-methyltransferase|nr:16S rRNA (guanine(966)-N(2))-methyltransferase RsmD [Lachnospiraceae bacterium]
MRVIAGSRRSLPLKTLEGDATRPTADKYKETLFNCIQMDVPGSVFMDLFSGSGSIAIEALSRGAKRAILVENSKDALGIIKDNIHFTKFEDESEIVRSDVISYLRRLDRIDADIIFIDPPYGKGLEKEAVLVLDSKKFKNEDAIIIIEARLDEDMSFIDDTGFVIYKTKNYKTNKHVFLSIRS